MILLIILIQIFITYAIGVFFFKKVTKFLLSLVAQYEESLKLLEQLQKEITEEKKIYTTETNKNLN